MTSTGYVRRDCKRAMEGFNHKQLLAMLPDLDCYMALREAFRGGNTHASRWYARDILTDVKSTDRSSSYPDVMVNCLFPMKVRRYLLLPLSVRKRYSPFRKNKRTGQKIRLHRQKPLSSKDCFYLSR